MDKSTFSRPVPIEHIRNVGVFNECGDDDLTDFILDYTEPQPHRYTEKELAFPREVLSYSSVSHPKSLKAIFKRSDKTYQINLLSYLFPEKANIDIIADGAIFSSDSLNNDQNVIKLLTYRCKHLVQPIPCMIFLDYKHLPSNKERLPMLADYAKRSNCPVLPLQLPMIADAPFTKYSGIVRKEQREGFCGYIDLLTQKAYIIEGLYGDEITEIPIPDDLSIQAKEALFTILENLADSDPEIEKAYCNGTTVDSQILKQALRKKTVSGKIIPVFCGIAAHFQSVTCCFGKSYNWQHKKGIQPFLDAITDYFPSPIEAQAQTIRGINPFTGAQEIRHCSQDEPFSALVFATSGEFKVLSGIAVPGMTVYNSLTEKTMQLDELKQKTGTDRIDHPPAVCCGETAQLKSQERSIYHAVLSDPKHPFILPTQFVAAIALNDPDDAANELFFIDDSQIIKLFKNPLNGKSYFVTQSPSTTEYLISREQNCSCSPQGSGQTRLGIPEVFYRETITRPVVFDSRLNDSTGADCDIAVVLKLVPLSRGSGIVIKNLISDNTVPEKSITQVQTGIWEAAANGALAGYPMEDIQIEIIEIISISTPLSPQRLKNAGFNAMRKAVKQAAPILLEPWNQVQIYTDECVIGDVLAVITECGGMIDSVDSISPDTQLITAKIPTGALLRNFESTLRNVSRAKATLAHVLPGDFQSVSEAEQEEIIKRTLGTL